MRTNFRKACPASDIQSIGYGFTKYDFLANICAHDVLQEINIQKPHLNNVCIEHLIEHPVSPIPLAGLGAISLISHLAELLEPLRFAGPASCQCSISH